MVNFMVRTDDGLLRDMIEISGDRAALYRGPIPCDRSPLFTALNWWLSLEDLSDPGNQVTLDHLTCSTGWDDYAEAAAAISQSAICMKATYDDTNRHLAYVRFVPPCIGPGATSGVVSGRDNHHLALVNPSRRTSRWDADERWMVWSLTPDRPAWPDVPVPAQ